MRPATPRPALLHASLLTLPSLLGGRLGGGLLTALLLQNGALLLISFRNLLGEKPAVPDW